MNRLNSCNDCHDDSTINIVVVIIIIIIVVVVVVVVGDINCSCYLLTVTAGKWEDMEVYADMIPKDTYDSSFFRAIINIHANEFQKAQQV